MLNVVMRICDRVSLSSDRIVPKSECIIRCIRSLVTAVSCVDKYHIHIIDDNSSVELFEAVRSLLNMSLASKENGSYTINRLSPVDQTGMNNKKKSRRSLEVALDYIESIEDETAFVYLVEDDYLHKEHSIHSMCTTIMYLENVLGKDVGVFPQDFNQMYLHPSNPFNETYVKSCHIFPCPSGYFRTTWYTQESFCVRKKIFTQYREEIRSLLTIGDNDYNWEGNTLCKAWENVVMTMPLGSLVYHLSSPRDLPFYHSVEDLNELWKKQITSWSLEPDFLVQL